MPRYQCFMLEDTGRIAQSLRRYSRVNEPCPAHKGYNYHSEEARIEDAPLVLTEEGYVRGGGEWPHDDERWPKACACGYVFSDGDGWTLDRTRLWKRADTGEEVTLHNAPPGAMVRAPWTLNTVTAPADGDPLAVMTPAGLWVIDECATDCQYYGKKAERPKDHHCWTRDGVPPMVTASPSINFPGRYHGWLRGGFLEDAE